MLRKRKRLIVVVNDRLMDNHQLELASELQRQQHLHYCAVDQLGQLLRDYSGQQLRPFPAFQPGRFASFVDQFVEQTIRRG